MLLILILSVFYPFLATSQTIAEKKASLTESTGDLNAETENFLNQINLELSEARQEERQIVDQAYKLYIEGAPDGAFKTLITQLKQIRFHIENLQSSWHDMIASQGKQESYALWYQPDTTIEQLILDYGAQDYVYLMKPEIADIGISVNSNLPIPRAAWGEMLEMILNQNGIGIRQLNPFLRELYLIKQDRSAIRLITSNPRDLELFSPDTRVAFLLTPDPSDVRRTWFFLDNFANPDSTSIQMIGRDILIAARISEVRDLLRLYDFISQNRGDKEYKAVTLNNVKANDMAKVLRSVFNQTEEPSPLQKTRNTSSSQNQGAAAKEPLPSPTEANGLQVLSLGSNSGALFLIGTKEEVRKAEEVIREVEGQLGGARDKVIYWYSVKHSDPLELAEVLSKVYNLMVSSGASREADDLDATNNGNGGPRTIEQKTIIERDNRDDGPRLDFIPPPYPTDPYFQLPVSPIAPAFVFPANSFTERPDIDQGNFIVDVKTSSIVMVVEADLLGKLKELLRKMDVPKKMVQIEVLLFEKKIAKQNSYGLNLLRFGESKRTPGASANFNEVTQNGIATGIFDFLWSRACSNGIPAFDLTYRFLLSQDDVTINASPSVLTVNQTPAFISIQEEISVNTGIVELNTVGGTTLKDSFQRAQYGITLKITPTIHNGDEQENIDTITLDSDITFDTFDTVELPADGRPNVTRRNVKNIARVADGETVIIGGLRRKTTEDSNSSVPFIGEIPGIGKLFSETAMRDGSTEMFIFITPKIVIDPACDLEWIRSEEMLRRPGDIPEFLCGLIEAEECEKNRVLESWMTTIFGSSPGRCHTPGWQNNDTCSQSMGEYDGR